jgi:SAM-dependent methyltransferase
MQLAPKSGYQATDGAAYQVFLGRWTERLAAALLGSLELPPDGALLDVGCGTGSLAFAMAKHWPGRQVNGVDIAEPYVAFARARAVSGLPVFDLADICSMPYADGAFAAAIAQLVLNFVSDPAMALAEMRRVTRPAGLVAATVWDFRGGLVYQRMFWDTATVLDPTAASVRDRLFSAPLALPETLPKLFTEVGLRAVALQSITIRMDYASFNDYWEPLCGGQGPVGTYVAQLEPALREQIAEAVRLAYLSGAADGPRSLTATAWLTSGVVPQ